MIKTDLFCLIQCQHVAVWHSALLYVFNKTKLIQSLIYNISCSINQQKWKSYCINTMLHQLRGKDWFSPCQLARKWQMWVTVYCYHGKPNKPNKCYTQVSNLGCILSLKIFTLEAWFIPTIMYVECLHFFCHVFTFKHHVPSYILLLNLNIQLV